MPVFVVGFLEVPNLGHSAAAPLHRQAPAARQHQVLHLRVVMGGAQGSRPERRQCGGGGLGVTSRLSINKSQKTT
jgi:hypothetical protein